jgi:hypothetical protein
VCLEGLGSVTNLIKIAPVRNSKRLPSESQSKSDAFHLGHWRYRCQYLMKWPWNSHMSSPLQMLANWRQQEVVWTVMLMDGILWPAVSEIHVKHATCLSVWHAERNSESEVAESDEIRSSRNILDAGLTFDLSCCVLNFTERTFEQDRVAGTVWTCQLKYRSGCRLSYLWFLLRIPGWMPGYHEVGHGRILQNLTW